MHRQLPPIRQLYRKCIKVKKVSRDFWANFLADRTIMASTIRFTKEGYRKIQEEYQRLLEQRKETVDALRTAREMGDLSENAAYKVARQRLSQTDSRLRHLKKLLLTGKVTLESFMGVVAFGTKVTVGKDDGTQDTYTIVEGFESDPTVGKLSTSSPIGKALLGKKTGEKVTVNIPAGSV